MAIWRRLSPTKQLFQQRNVCFPLLWTTLTQEQYLICQDWTERYQCWHGRPEEESQTASTGFQWGGNSSLNLVIMCLHRCGHVWQDSDGRGWTKHPSHSHWHRKGNKIRELLQNKSPLFGVTASVCEHMSALYFNLKYQRVCFPCFEHLCVVVCPFMCPSALIYLHLLWKL